MFSSVACVVLCSLAFLLSLEGLNPLKLDEVGFCFVPFRLMLAWQLDLFLVLLRRMTGTLSRCADCVVAAGDLFIAGLHCWACLKFSCSSGLFWWNIFICQPTWVA